MGENPRISWIDKTDFSVKYDKHIGFRDPLLGISHMFRKKSPAGRATAVSVNTRVLPRANTQPYLVFPSLIQRRTLLLFHSLPVHALTR